MNIWSGVVVGAQPGVASSTRLIRSQRTFDPGLAKRVGLATSLGQHGTDFANAAALVDQRQDRRRKGRQGHQNPQAIVLCTTNVPLSVVVL